MLTENLEMIAIPYTPESLYHPSSPRTRESEHREADRYNFLPRRLHGRFPEIWILILEKNNRAVIEGTLLLLAWLTLFASVIGIPHQAELASFFAAILAPVGITLWYLVRPLNLYEKSTFTPQSLRNLPTRDAAACELAAILRSPNAGRFLFQCTQCFWLVCFVPMSVATFALHGNPVWAANPYWILRLSIFCLLLLAIYRIELLRWAIGVMKAGE